MAVKEYSIKKLGRDYKVSEHFTLGELQSKDGADIVLVDDALMAWLEKMRAVGPYKILVNSMYRTPAHNVSQGGASKSKHTMGMAADIQMIDTLTEKNVDAKLLCCLCQDMGIPGIAYINSRSIHIDSRPSGTYRGDERYGFDNNVGGDFYKYFKITKAQVEALKKEEEEMTQNEFNQMMNTWISQQAAKDPSAWSAAARDWAEKNGVISGTGSGYSYLAYCTREQMVQFLYNFYNNVVSKMGGGSGDAVLQAMIDALNGLKK